MVIGGLGLAFWVVFCGFGNKEKYSTGKPSFKEAREHFVSSEYDRVNPIT